MLDRMSLSLANELLDEDGKVYINYSLEDIMDTLNCGKTKAVALLKELDSESGIGRIEKKNMGIAKASVFNNRNHDCSENEPERVQNLNPNKNNINKTNMSKTILSINLDSEDEIDEIQGYSRIIKENIDYDSLLMAHPYDQEMVEGIYDLILETVLSKNAEITIAGDVYP